MRTETLLEDDRFLTRLASRLTFGPEDPADVVQQTWLAALSRPPKDEATRRSWLVVVLRNFLRQSRRSRLRRRARELAAARPEAATPVEEVRAREETRSRVVAAVLDLDEPYRTTVLLRHFEDLPPRKIAARLDVPVATVKSRLARAHRMLRERLDDEGGGDGRRWAIALLPLAGSRGRGTEGLPTLARVGAGAAAAALITAAGVSMFGGGGSVLPGGRGEEGDPETARAVYLPIPEGLTAGDGSRSFGGDSSLPWGAPKGGRVVDGAGRAVPGATVLSARDPLCPVASEIAREGGRFHASRINDEGFEWLCACAPNVGASPWVRCREGADDVVLELGPGGVITGRVAHPETNEAAPGAVVEINFGWELPWNHWTTQADEEGCYRISGVPLGTWLHALVRNTMRTLSFYCPDSSGREEHHEEFLSSGRAKVLSRPGEVFERDLPGRRIRGIPLTLRLVPADGTALPEKVDVHRSWRWPYAWGTRSGEHAPNDRSEIDVFLPEGRTSIRVEAGDLYGSVPGRDVEGDGPRETLTVHLRQRPTIRARLVDEAGTPMDHAGINVQVLLSAPGHGSSRKRRTTDAHGEIDVGDLFAPTPGGYVEGMAIEFAATVPGYLMTNREFPNCGVPLTAIEAMALKADGRPLMLDIPVVRSCPVRILVVDRSGEPLPGVRFRPEHPERFAESEWTSDGRGEIVVGLRVMPRSNRGGLAIQAQHPYENSHFDVGSCLIGAKRGRCDLAELRLTVSYHRPVRVRVLSTDGSVLAKRRVRVYRREFTTDAAGEFEIDVIEYRDSVHVAVEGFLPRGFPVEDGRVEARLMPGRRVAVRVVLPDGVSKEKVSVYAHHPERRSRWSWGVRVESGGFEVEVPVGEPAAVSARIDGGAWEGNVPVPADADVVEVVLSEVRREPVSFRFVHPDGTPATDPVDLKVVGNPDNHGGLKPDANGIVTLELYPGKRRLQGKPRMAGHILAGSPRPFEVPAPGPVEFVMVRAQRVDLVLDGGPVNRKVDVRQVKVSVADEDGPVDFERTSGLDFDPEKTHIALFFRKGPATIRIEFDGETYELRHEKPTLEPVRIRLR